MKNLLPFSVEQVFAILIFLCGIVICFLVYRYAYHRKKISALHSGRAYGQSQLFQQSFSPFFKMLGWLLVLFGLFLMVVEWYLPSSDLPVRL